MKESVYLETSIISYLCARPSRDLVVAARQQTTWQWWDTRRGDFDLYVSQAVLREIAAGNPEMASQRLKFVSGIPSLRVDDDAEELANALLTDGPLPARAADDAVHLAVAAVHGIDYLLTWNCRHLANAQMLVVVRRLLERRGCHVPMVCVPDELLGEE